MPSGARKRKAAKKKQGKATPVSADPSSTTSSTQGDEDLKHRQSDGDHNTDGEERIEKSTAEVKNGDAQVEKAAGQDDGDVQIEGESKPGIGFDEKKGDSSSSGSSSDSDDGAREVEKQITFEENAPVVDLGEAAVPMSDGPIEVIHATPVAKADDSLAECVSEVGEGNILVHDENVPVHSGALADTPSTPEVIELEQKENVVAKMSSQEESAGIAEVAMELAPADKDEENPSPIEVAMELATDKEAVRLPEVAKELATEDKDEENPSPVEVAMELATDKETVRLPEVAKELATEDKDEENASPLEVAKELVPDDGKYKNIDIPATSDATESAVDKNEEKLTLSYNAKRVDTTEISGHSQARATSAVRPDQSTSWKSCCGLFEALTGNSR